MAVSSKNKKFYPILGKDLVPLLVDKGTKELRSFCKLHFKSVGSGAFKIAYKINDDYLIKIALTEDETRHIKEEIETWKKSSPVMKKWLAPIRFYSKQYRWSIMKFCEPLKFHDLFKWFEIEHYCEHGRRIFYWMNNYSISRRIKNRKDRQKMLQTFPGNRNKFKELLSAVTDKLFYEIAIDDTPLLDFDFELCEFEMHNVGKDRSGHPKIYDYSIVNY